MDWLKRHPVPVAGLGITLLLLFFALIRVDFLDTLELKVYDVMMRLRSVPEADSPVVLVDIDDDAIEKLGRWPWPRSLLARGIEKINAGRPRVIGLNIILSEAQESEGLQVLNRLKDRYGQQIAAQAGPVGIEFVNTLDRFREQLNHDQQLADALTAAGNVILPVFLKEAAVAPEKRAKADEALFEHAVQNIRSPAGAVFPRSDHITLPIAFFRDSARSLGHINLHVDADGTARRERPLYNYSGLFIPSYAVKIVSAYLNVPDNRIRARLGAELQLGSLKIPLTAASEMLIGFKGAAGTFKRYAYFDVVSDKVPPRIFRDKIVLVSPSAAGIMNPLSTPTDATMPVGEYSANTVWSMLNNNAIRQPEWEPLAEMGLILLMGLTVTFLIPRLKALSAGVLFVGLLALVIGTATVLFVSEGLWVRSTYPVVLLVLGYLGVTSIQYFFTEAGKEKVEGESAETNRMLGLSFQSQGLLDMAFDKLRRVPVDGEMKNILYNLALDYERKRQLNKAAMVYEYIEEHDPVYKDVAQKKQKLMQASETLIYGDGLWSGGNFADELSATATETRPTLGRYEIIKPLGKGAMGVVYLGQDPRINRMTAIKTFRFGEVFDPEDIDELKVKFFREAESAGTLSHPHIVTIYDAGDEQDLAYIAMEYLEGDTLEKFTKKDHLLPMLKVAGIIADIADGLDYAHRKGIVHRDIKPANVMMLKTGVIKITDFGIARITATSQTQTGIVKGTPYYMSPEQISGRKVDGRSDIFSLGVMMFQLLTGRLPFKGENPAALMHRIMHVRHPDPKTLNPKILTPFVKVIDRALEKDREKRYPEAAQMKRHLADIRRTIDAVIARKKAANPG
jgi:serine/threonine-protein kinase